MKKIRLTTQVDDDYEPGYCHGCPFAYEEEYDDGWEEHCVLGYPYWKCPIEIIKEEVK